MKKFLLIGVLVSTVLLAFLGCDIATDSDGKNLTRSLEWARDIADGIRNDELSDGELFEFLVRYIDENGLLESDASSPWVIRYYIHQYPPDTIRVKVYADGETDYSTYDGESKITLPAYSNDNVSAWVKTADAEVDEENLDYDYRWLWCYHSYIEEDPCNLAYVRYYVGNDDAVATVVIYADTGEVFGSW